MLNAPDALELVSLAREAIVEHLLPEVEGNARYQGLMAVNALGIALRELTENNTPTECRQLRELYAPALSDDESVTEMNTRLAADIRAGDFDGSEELHLRKLLRQQVLARLAVSNPKRLK